MRPGASRRAWASAAALAAAATLAGCGGAKPLPKPCSVKGRAAVARATGVSAARIAATASTGSNASPQCTYAAARATVVVNVDTSPQPYFILERTSIESQQNFSTAHTALTVIQVPHIGLDAFWFPSEQKFMTTDGVNLLTVTITWPGASLGRLEGAGEAAARAYLGKLVLPPGYEG